LAFYILTITIDQYDLMLIILQFGLSSSIQVATIANLTTLDDTHPYTNQIATLKVSAGFLQSCCYHSHRLVFTFICHHCTTAALH
jgi:hypothetical protein